MLDIWPIDLPGVGIQMQKIAKTHAVVAIPKKFGIFLFIPEIFPQSRKDESGVLAQPKVRWGKGWLGLELKIKYPILVPFLTTDDVLSSLPKSAFNLLQSEQNVE